MYEESLEDRVFSIKIRINKFKRENDYLFTKITDKDKAVLVFDKENPHFVIKNSDKKDV